MADRARGTVYLVGAGPGDPGLLTLQAVRLLRRADVVVHDALVSPRVLEWVHPDAERIDVGKRAGGRRTPQHETNRLLVEAARRARVVVRLKGGDPFVFGRGGEEALALREAGVRFRVVPGVTSAVGAAAYAGIPLTHRGVASAVTLVTGHEDTTRPDGHLDWEQLARIGGTLVVYMGVRRLPELIEQLLRGGRSPETPSAVVEWGTYAHQRTIVAPLHQLAERVEEAVVEAPALVVIGDVVGLREQLRWRKRRPLSGVRALVPRSRAQTSRLARSLARQGAEVTEFPRFRPAPPLDPAPLRQAVERIGGYDWVVLTSPTAVEYLWKALLASGLDVRACAGVRFACFGTATAAALLERGVRAEVRASTFVPETAVREMEAIAPVSGAHIFFPREAATHSTIAERLRECGARVEEVEAYRQVVESEGAEELRRRLGAGEIDVVAFASSLTVRHFVGGLGADAGKAAVAAIGPSTARTADEHGLPVHLLPAEPSMEGLMGELQRWAWSRRSHEASITGSPALYTADPGADAATVRAMQSGAPSPDPTRDQ